MKIHRRNIYQKTIIDTNCHVNEKDFFFFCFFVDADTYTYMWPVLNNIYSQIWGSGNCPVYRILYVTKFDLVADPPNSSLPKCNRVSVYIPSTEVTKIGTTFHFFSYKLNRIRKKVKKKGVKKEQNERKKQQRPLTK